MYLMLLRFNQSLPFLVVFASSLLVALKRAVMLARDKDADLEMDRVIGDAQSDRHRQPRTARQSSAR